MRWQTLALRAGLLAPLVALGTVLFATATLQRLLPFQASPLLVAPALLVALLPALLARGSPLPAASAVVVALLAFASYGASRLDWLRTLKDFGVAERGPDLLRLLLGLLALALLWALHAVDLAFRLRQRSLERGVLPGQARAAFRVSLRQGATMGGAALGATLALGALVWTAAALGPRLLPVERMAFVAPLLAGLLVALAALLLVGVPRRSADKGEKVRLRDDA